MMSDRQFLEICEAMDEPTKARLFMRMVRRWPSMVRRYHYYKRAKLAFNYLFDGREEISESLGREIADLIEIMMYQYNLHKPEISPCEWDERGRESLTPDFMMFMMEHRPRGGGMAGAALRERLEALAREPWGGLVPFGIRHGPGGYRVPAGFRRAPRRAAG